MRQEITKNSAEDIAARSNRASAIKGEIDGLGTENPAGEPHHRHRQSRTAQHGLGVEVSRTAGSRHKVFRRGSRSQGRSARPRQQDDHGNRPAHRHRRLHRRPLFGHHQRRAHQRHRLLQLRRLLRRRVEVRRLGHDHLRGQGSQARLRDDYRRRLRDPRRFRHLGHQRLAHRRVDQDQAPRPDDAHLGHRHLG